MGPDSVVQATESAALVPRLSEATLYQLLVGLLEPYTFLAICLAGALAWAWRTTRPRGRALKAACVLMAVLIVASTEAAGYLAIGSLEFAYPDSDSAPRPTDTLIVLSGGLSVSEYEGGLKVRLGDDTLKRCLHAVRLYRRSGGCRMILSGGKVDWNKPGPTYAEAMYDFVVELGVRPEDVVLEKKSSSTYENALDSKPLVQEREGGTIFLVTEAFHMRRSEKCFRKVGIEVVPAPCGHHTGQFDLEATTFLPSARGVSQVVRASHEWLGLAWYRLRGRI